MEWVKKNKQEYIVKEHDNWSIDWSRAANVRKKKLWKIKGTNHLWKRSKWHYEMYRILDKYDKINNQNEKNARQQNTYPQTRLKEWYEERNNEIYSEWFTVKKQLQVEEEQGI